MTVGTRVKTALSNLKSVQADFESFALETQDQDAKQLWADAAQQTRRVLEQVEQRVRQMEQEEPEYRGY
ncbi:MAG TPA: DUF1657 domain-containing protein [Bacillota bacterium]